MTLQEAKTTEMNGEFFGYLFFFTFNDEMSKKLFILIFSNFYV